MKIIAAIEHPTVIANILAHLSLPDRVFAVIGAYAIRGPGDALWETLKRGGRISWRGKKPLREDVTNLIARYNIVKLS